MAGDGMGYAPIRDYALIGDCHGAALVSRSGSIDWCCLGRFDADPVFCRLLDAERGGHLTVVPAGSYTADRRYRDGTNILETDLTTADGVVRLTDFMPLGRRPGSGTHDYVDLMARKWLVRIVEVAQGEVDLHVRYRPSVAFAREAADLHASAGAVTCRGAPLLYHQGLDFRLTGDEAHAQLRLRQGDRCLLVLAAEATAAGPLETVDELLDTTAAFWREWIAYCRYRGPHAPQIKRSLLTIKQLIYAPSGAIVAAPTTSLPEGIGGERNWDYRFCWLRDASFALYALAVSGYGGEARHFSAYLQAACAASAPDLQIMYGIGLEADLAEEVLEHLDGYRGSRPVRRGNDAFRQRQIDVYGEILDWALVYRRLGGRLDKGMRGMLSALANFVAGHWQEPDQGIWEVRGPPRHHIHSKIMSWVALDRAIRLLGENQRWAAERERIAAQVHERGCDPKGDHLIQAYDFQNSDAALLLTPMFGFPLPDGVLQRTVEAVERELRSGDLLARYRGEDGLTGDEGAFVICSFWLVDALLHLDRFAEAESLFDRLLAQANDVGLFSEEIDPADGAFLGNHPQAYTHLALVGSAVHLQLYREGGSRRLRGTYADRARSAVTATLGWRAIVAAFAATWRVGRILPSRASILGR